MTRPSDPQAAPHAQTNAAKPPAARSTKPIPIRRKLGFWLLGVLTLHTALLAPVAFLWTQHALSSQLDRLLDEDAMEIARMMNEFTRSGEAPNCATWSDQISKGLFGSRVTVWQLAKETSPQMCAATRNAPPLPLPNDFELQRSGLAVAGNGAEHYWRSMPWEQTPANRWLIQVSRPAGHVHDLLGQLVLLMVAISAAALVLAWFGAQKVADSILAPIRQIVRAARTIGISRMSKRLREGSAPQELHELTRVINDLLQRFQEGLERERGFVSDIAHELRTPLAAQSVIAQNALGNGRSNLSDYQVAMRQVLIEARHMRRFSDRLLALARIEAQPYEATAMTAVDVHDAIHHTVATLRLLSDEKDQTLVVRCAPHIEALGEVTMLRQALMNVVHNAIDHCPTGTRITISGTRLADRVLIEVDDDGPGIAPQTRKHLFKRFQGGPARSAQAARKGRGLGIGLSIVKALMRSQGGSIHLATKTTPGARFCLTLPLPSGQHVLSALILESMETAPAPLSAESHTASPRMAQGRRSPH